jgi:hypothetical protein
MSQRNRRALAALGLTAALLLGLPVPSRAAGLWEVSAQGLTARAWAWLESLGLPGWQAAAAPHRPAAVREKEGPAIDPDGRTVPGATSTTPSSPAPDQEGVIRPGGQS